MADLLHVMNAAELFITKAKKTHGNKYNYSLVDYERYNHEVTIVCPEHGKFNQKPYLHLRYGCRGCAGNRKHTAESFIAKAKKIHGNKYDYSKVNYVNARIKIVIICQEHGEFNQKPGMHLFGRGCPRCTRHTTESFVVKAKEIHGNRYDYSKINYINNKTKITIVCSEHGGFEQIPSNHISKGSGCRKCAISNRTSTSEEFTKKRRKFMEINMIIRWYYMLITVEK